MSDTGRFTAIPWGKKLITLFLYVVSLYSIIFGSLFNEQSLYDKFLNYFSIKNEKYDLSYFRH